VKIYYNFKYAKNHEKIKPEEELEFKYVLKLLKPEQGEKILEIGCNTGEFCYLLKKLGVKVKGIDINKEAIRIAKRKYKSIKFEVKDIEKDNIKGLYDKIVMIQVIEHLSKPIEILKKIKKLLKPGGILVLSTINHWALIKFFCWLRGKKFSGDPTHLWNFNPLLLHSILKKSDLKINKIVTYYLYIPFLKRIWKNYTENNFINKITLVFGLNIFAKLKNES